MITDLIELAFGWTLRLWDTYGWKLIAVALFIIFFAVNKL